MSSFKAVQVSKFGGPDVLEITSISEKELESNQVLVNIKAVGVNPVDTYIRSGNYVRKPQLPYTPGSDAAGIIEKIGSSVTNWKCGDRVYLSGTLSGSYAEKTICNISQIHLLPDNISFKQGAAIYVPYATAYASLFLGANAKPGESVLIHGASGGVGIAAVQLAKARGLRVLGTASSNEGLEIIKKYGGEAFNHSENGYEQQILNATNGNGVNIILEMLSNVNLDKDISTLIAKFGRVIIIGCRGTIEINPRALMGKTSSIMGMALANTTQEEFTEIFSAIDIGLTNNTLDPVISKYSFTLETASEAHKHIIERPSGTIGKVILTTNE